MSVGYSNSISGAKCAISRLAFARPKNKFGGAMCGYSAPQISGGGDRTFTDFISTRRWVNSAYGVKEVCASQRQPITPFRAATHAGDPLSRQNYACHGTFQSPQNFPGVYGFRTSLGNQQFSCQPSVVYTPQQLNSTVPASACNVKYVYNGSDYVLYKINSTMLRDFYPLTDGGNSSNPTQSVMRRLALY